MTYLESIVASGTVERRDGTTTSLHSNTSLDQCRFIQEIIRKLDAATAIEVGMAYGISTLAICEAVAAKPSASVVSIDPFQRTSWEEIGILNVQRAGYSGMMTHIGEASYEALPMLLRQGARFDFAYIDTTKVFDWILVDAFYITRLLNVGGVVVFDDCAWPGVRKVVRCLTAWPHLEVFATYSPTPTPKARKVGNLVSRTIPVVKKVLRPELIETDEDLGIAAECVAFRKVSEDTRSWDWSEIP